MLLALVTGAVAYGVAAALAPWQLAVLVGFDVWAAVQLVWIARVLRLDGPATRDAAQVEDDSRAQANMAINASGLASLVGVGLALSKARQVGPVQSPDYHDFAYFGFTIGMTYQVSDTNITDRMIRRTVTRHALVSFLFATVIIGLTINVMAGFIR